MFKIIAVFSMEAQSYASDHGVDMLTKRTRKFRKGYDWTKKTFKTEAERQAYIDGLEDGNGWHNEPMWEKR
jgi:hypothetical protein